MVRKPAGESQNGHGDPGYACCFHRHFPSYKRAFRAVKLIAFEVENIVLDVRKSNGERKCESLCDKGEARLVPEQFIADKQRNHCDYDVDGTSHFKKRAECRKHRFSFNNNKIKDKKAFINR